MYDLNTINSMNEKAAQAKSVARSHVHRMYIGRSRNDMFGMEYTGAYLKSWIANAFEVHGIEAFTIYEAQGFWQGMSENTIIVELIGADERIVKKVASMAKDQFHQNEILLTFHKLDMMTI